MAVVTYPLLTVADDSGAVVSGATVAITSVRDKAGTDVTSHGATVSQSGANVSVDYDAETKGEAWIVLAISKVGSTFTGLNAAPAFYLAKDSGRILASTPQTGDAYAVVNDASFGNAKLVRSTTPANTLDVSSTGEAGLDFANIKQATGATTLTNITVPAVTTVTTTTNLTNGPATGVLLAASQTLYAPAVAGDAMTLDLAQTGLSPRALDAVADGSLTVGDALVAAISAAAGKETVVGTAYTVKTPSTGTVIRTFTLDSATSPTSRQ